MRLAGADQQRTDRVDAVDLLIVVIPSIGRDRFLHTVEEAFKVKARVSFVPSHILPSDPWVDYQDIDGVLSASFGGGTRRIAYELLKESASSGIPCSPGTRSTPV